MRYTPDKPKLCVLCGGGIRKYVVGRWEPARIDGHDAHRICVDTVKQGQPAKRPGRAKG